MATTRSVLQQHVPSVPVREADMVQCYRTARGRKVVCRLANWGPGTTRDAIYGTRTSLQRDERGARRDPQNQIYIDEKSTVGAHTVLMKLRAAGEKW